MDVLISAHEILRNHHRIGRIESIAGLFSLFCVINRAGWRTFPDLGPWCRRGYPLCGESVIAVCWMRYERWSGGVEFDVQRDTVVERVRESCGVVCAEFDEGVLGSRVGVGVSGEFCWIGCDELTLDR